MYKQYNSAREMWLDARDMTLQFGHSIGSRDGACKEILGWCGTLVSGTVGWVGGRSRRYAAAELAWYLSGDREGWIKHYAPGYARFLNADGEADGAYGHRWAMHRQLFFVLQELADNPESRRAIMTCWDPGEDIRNIRVGTKDACCTLSMQFLVRNDRVSMIVTMRSNDIWTGMPYDVFCFTAIQRLIAYELGYGVGVYQHQVGSLHLYDRDVNKQLKSWHTNDTALQTRVESSWRNYVLVERALRNSEPCPHTAGGLFGALATVGLQKQASTDPNEKS